MSILESLRTATTGLTTNKLRAALTMLGIIIGVASVVALMSVGEGVEASITGEIQGLGANLIFVTADQPEDSTAPAFVTTADAEALTDPFNAPALVAVAPAMQGQLRVSHDDEDATLTVSGTNGDYDEIRSLDLSMGGFLTDADVQLADLHLTFVLAGQFFNRWYQSHARLAVVRPDIHHHRDIGASHFLVKVFVVELDGFLFARSIKSQPA